MKNYKFLHLQSYFAQQYLLHSENRLVFRGGKRSPEKPSAAEKKELRNKIKGHKEQIKETQKKSESFKKQLDKYFTQKNTFEVKKVSDIKDILRKVLANSTDPNAKENKAFGNYVMDLFKNVDYVVNKNKAELKKHEPLKVTVNPGGVIDFADQDDKRVLSVDLKKESFYATKINELKNKVSNLRDRINQKKTKVIKQTRDKHTQLSKTINFSGKFGKLHEAIKNSPKLKGKVKVVKVGRDYVVKFLGKNKKERRKNELKLKIEDIFNLGLVNRYPESVLKIHVTNPGIVSYYATYVPSRGSFYIDGTDKRATIYQNGRIRVLKFQVIKNPPKASRNASNLSTVKSSLSSKARTKAQVEANKQRQFEREQRKDYLFNKYYNFIFKKDRFGGHKLLQSAEDFNNWSRVSHVLGPILAAPPFNIKTASLQKRYMELVIQGTGFWDPNWEMQGKDFFKYGGIRYKGGYEQFIKDYKRLSKKFDTNESLSDKEMEHLEILEDIAVAIARVYEALKTMKPLKAGQESQKEKFERTTLLNIPKATTKELKEIKSNNYLFYHLPLLTHEKEQSSPQIDILVGNSVNRKLFAQVEKAANKLPKGAISEGDMWRYRNNPTRLLFLTFGFDTLVAKGSIKKVDNKRYVLTKVPTTNKWAELALKHQAEQSKAKAGNMKSWEKVRGSLSAHHKAMNFINKIFSGKETSVANNLRSNWSRFCHWEWAKKKYVSMGNLTDVESYGKNEFNLATVEKRGYLDLKRQVSERSGESGMFRIPENKHGELINTVNSYLVKGIHMTIANAPKKERTKVIRNLLNTFGLNIEIKKDDLENATAIASLISVKGLSTKYLTPDQIKFIRLGFVEDRYMKSVEKKEMKDQYFSDYPHIRKIQEKLYKQGLAITQMPKVEADIHAGMGILMKSKKVVGAGGFAGFTIRYKSMQGHAVHATLGFGGLKEGMSIHAALGAKFKLSKSWNLYIDVGAGAALTKGGSGVGAGATARVETGFVPNSANKVGIGGGVGVGLGGLGFSLYAYWRYDTEQALKNIEKEALEKFAQIERTSGWNNKVPLIRSHPDYNVRKMVAHLDEVYGKKGKNGKIVKPCPPKIIYYAYEKAKGKLLNAARLKQKLPPIKEVGFGGVVSTSGFGGGLWLTVQVPWTEEVVAVRHPVAGFDRYSAETEASKDLEKKLGKKVTIVKDFVMKGENAMLYFDSQMGGKGLARIGRLQKSQMEQLSADSSFEQIKKIMAKLNIDAKLVPRDAKDKSKGYFVQITPLNIEGSNVEIQIDPELRQKGVILDNKSTPQRILLTASAVKTLFITRKRIKFPFQSKGAMDLNIITFKTDKKRYTPEIREESVQYLYKKQGERYQVVEGENARQIPKDLRNVMTLAAFRGSKRKFEKFDNIQLINFKKYRRASKDMEKALRVVTSKEFKLNPGNTPHLRKFARQWYNLNQTYFLRKLIQMRTPATEEKFKTLLFKKLIKDYDTYRANLSGTKPLSQYEQNVLYAMLMDRSFLKIAKNPSRNMPKARIERALSIRKSLFKQYMVKFVTKWKAKYPDAWKQIKEADPNITPAAVANLIALAMPKNYAHMKEMLQEPTQIGRHMKFLSYTQKLKSESMPSAYGGANPEAIRKNFFKMFGVTKFNLSSKLDKRKQAVARVILNLISPLKMGELKDNKERVNFLDSELSLMLISLYDPEKGISPMIEVLGMSNYENMTKLYSALRNEKDPAKAAKLLQNSAIRKSFDQFRKMVLKVRNAQLSGRKSAEYNKFTIHFDTEVMAGPYLKCANGTIAVRQRFRITTKKSLRIPWAGARAERSVHTGGKFRKKAVYLKIPILGFYVPGTTPKKPYTPPDRGTPEKPYTPPSRN